MMQAIGVTAVTGEIEIVRSKRKTLSIEVKPDLRVIVRAPRSMALADIQRFVAQKTPWIEAHLARLKAAQPDLPEAFSSDELEALKKQARAMLLPRVSELAMELGAEYGRVAVRAQVSRWGSCSAKGNLNFNCLLALCPEAVRDYVIIHELCHLKHMNHYREFWLEVEAHCPSYRASRAWLKEKGGNELFFYLR